jgi:hypothetical protein
VLGWDVNTARNGVIVNGDHVTATGLFVEHCQQYNVIWNGEDGRTVFFQNELPAAYKVAEGVQRHELWGARSHIFTMWTRPSMPPMGSRRPSGRAWRCITS